MSKRTLQGVFAYLVHSIAALVLLAFPLTALAQITLDANVAPTTGSTEDSYRLVVTVTGVQSAPTPTLKGGEDFTVSFLGPQTSLSVMNGTVDMKVSYLYRMTPNRAGELTSPIAEIDTPQGKLSTKPVVVTVTEENSAPSRGTPTGQGEQNQDPTSPLQGGEVKNFFLDQTAIPKERVFVGQQVVNTVSLYTRLQATEIRLDDLSADGFWQETLSDDQRNTVQIRGLDFSNIQILKSLYPLRSGRVQIHPRRVTAKIPKSVRRPPLSQFDPFSEDIFENFFGAVEFKDIEALAQGIDLDVLPLPDPPEDIAPHLTSIPLVGDTGVKIDYSLDVLKIGESKNVTIQVTTEGNSNPIKQLPFKVPAGIKVYEERAEVSYDRSGRTLKTIKRFKYTLVPLKGGYFTVPGVTLAYFDPRTEQYKVVKSNDIAFVVQGGSPSSPLDINEGSNDTTLSPESEVLSPTTTPIDGSTSISQENNEGTAPPLYQEPTTFERIQAKMTTELLLLLIASLLGTVIIIFVAIQVKRPEQGSMVSREQIFTANTIRALQELYHDYLLAKLKVPKQGKGESGVTVDQIRALLTSSSNSTELIHSAKALLDDFERLQYSAIQENREETLTRLKERVHLLTQSWSL